MEWGEIPAYKQVAELLRQKIRNENLEPGDRLPSISALMAQHGVSITVIRMALKILQREGLVRSSAGKGNFVAGPAGEKTEGFDQVMQRLGAMQECIERLAGRLAEVEGRVAVLPDPAAHPTPPTGRRGQR